MTNEIDFFKCHSLMTLCVYIDNVSEMKLTKHINVNLFDGLSIDSNCSQATHKI